MDDRAASQAMHTNVRCRGENQSQTALSACHLFSSGTGFLLCGPDTTGEAMFTRELNFEAVKGLPADAPIPATIASDTPVDRTTFIEVLDCSARGIDLVRAPLPLIIQHESNRLAIGVAENIRAHGSRVSADIRFGSSAEAQQIRADVVAGIHRSLSVGYELLNAGEQIAPSTFKYSWRPHEVSIVSVPADSRAGFFRSKENHMNTIEQNETLSRSQRIAAGRDDSGPKNTDAQDIAAMAEQFKRFNGVEGMAMEAIRSGEPARLFYSRMIEHVGNASRGGNEVAYESVMSSGERSRYSLLRAIEAQVTNDWRQAGFEREIHDTLAQKVKHRSVTGLLVPAGDLAKKVNEERRYQQRDMTVGTPSAGGYLVGTDHRDDLFVDMLREKSVVMGLGATRISGLVGNVDIPALRGDVTAFWQATESTAITESNATIGQILLSPKTIGAYTEVTRRLLKQSTPQAEAILINSMTATLGRGIDTAVISGSGALGQPSGLLLQSGIGAVTGTSIDWTAILDFEADVSAAELDLAGTNVGWITTPLVRKLLKGRLKVAGYPQYLWESPDNRMNGYRAFATNACPADTLLFGDWSEIVIGEWGIVEIETAPALFAAGIVGIRAMADIDIGVKHAGAFSVAASVT